MNKLTLRAVSGVLYVAVIVCSLMFDDLYFCSLCMVFGVLASLEFGKLTAYKRAGAGKGKELSTEEREPPLTARATDVLGILLFTMPCLFMAFYNDYPRTAYDFISFAILTVSIAVGMWVPYAIIRCYVSIYQNDGYAMRDLAHSILAQAYIGIGLVTAQLLSLHDIGLVLLVFIYIWINDTGAFLVGSAYGRTKLFPRLSPNKSWEGFLGGLFLSIAAGIALLATGATTALTGRAGLTYWQVAFFLPIVVGISGTLGDLFESMIKRSVNAKDSGTLIPGHGGILDRIDSMLFAMPATFAFAFICYMLVGF